jgi:hypothetical protein
MAIVVSEERGTISIAALGDLESEVSIERLAQRLGRGLMVPNAALKPEPVPREAAR